MNSKRRSGWFWGLFLSYMFCAVPLMAFSIWKFSDYSAQIRQENAQRYENRVAEIARAEGELYKSMRAALVQIQSNPDLSQFAIESEALSHRDAMIELRKYISANSALEEIWLYYFEIPDNVYTAFGVWDYGTFCAANASGLAYGFQSVAAETLPTVWVTDSADDSAQSRSFWYIFPVSKRINGVDGILVFTVSVDSILEGLRDAFEGMRFCATLSLPDGTVLISEESEAARPESDSCVTIKGGGDSLVSIRVNVNRTDFEKGANVFTSYFGLWSIIYAELFIGLAIGFAAYYQKPFVMILEWLERHGKPATQIRYARGAESARVAMSWLDEKIEVNRSEWLRTLAETYVELYPRETGLALQRALEAGNYDFALETISELANKLPPDELGGHILYVVYLDLVRIVGRLSEKFHAEPPDALDLDGSGVEACREAMLRLCEYVCRAQREYAASNGKLADEIAAFIDAHSPDSAFGMDQLASAFGFSTSHMSVIMREAFDQTFTDYLWKVRLERAQTLLCETDEPVREIVSMVGYIDASNFTRKFRVSTGTTPGVYRKLYKIIGER